MPRIDRSGDFCFLLLILYVHLVFCLCWLLPCRSLSFQEVAQYCLETIPSISLLLYRVNHCLSFRRAHGSCFLTIFLSKLTAFKR